MKGRAAYILEGKKALDFSLLEDDFEELVRLNFTGEDFTSNGAMGRLRKSLESFDPDQDFLVITGPSTMCVLAFFTLYNKWKVVPIAVYRNGQYSYHIADGAAILEAV